MSRHSTLPPRARARPPFDEWPVQVYDPAFGFIWYAHPVVLVSQFTGDDPSFGAASFLQDHIDMVLARREAQVRAENGLFLLHDFRLVARFDPEVRTAFIERMRKRPHGYMRRAVTCVPASPMLRMVVQAVNLAATLISGGKTELVHDPAPALEQYGIEPPRVGERFPGR